MEYVSQSLSEKICVTDIFSYATKTLDESFGFAGERHNFPELVYVRSGIIGIAAEKNAYELTEGMAVIHKSGEFHAIRASGSTKPVVTILSFDTTPVISSAIFNVSLQQADILDKLCAKLEPSAVYSDINGSCVFSLNCSPQDMQIIRNYIEIFLLDLESGKTLTPSQTEKDILFSESVQYLRAHINEKLTIDDICRHIGVGKTYIKTLFKQYTGMGIMHYFLLLKLEKSTHLLKSGKSIGTISDELGFSSQNYFSYAFKKKYSVTPLKYKDTF